MGCAGSSPELEAQSAKNKRIEEEQANAQAYDKALKKLLLLGAGESGKSTLFKQMIQLYGKGYPESERATFTNIIYSNTIGAMQTLVEESEELKGHPEVKENTDIQPDNQELKEYMQNLDVNADVDSKVAEAIRVLWKDTGIQNTYSYRNLFQFPDSGAYFFDRLDEMEKDDYLPTEQDVLRSRVRTTGIVEQTFEIEGNTFQMYDVGGQRNERKKWIHCFENVTCVIFVAAISAYDQVLYEDETTNRMIEALNLFEEICNSRWFRETSMILFLNKRDLFAEKIARVPLSVCFKDYDGEGYEEGCEFLEYEFLSRNHSPDKDIYAHVTCATDTANIAHVFESVKDTVIKGSLKAGGLY